MNFTLRLIAIMFFSSHFVLLSALTCSDYNWDRTIEIENTMYDIYEEGFGLMKEACTYDLNADPSNYKSIVNNIESRVIRIDEAHELFKRARKKLTRVKDRWYDLHESCSGSNSENAYDYYSEVFEWGREDLYGGEGDTDAVDDLLRCRNKLTNYKARILEKFD